MSARATAQAQDVFWRGSVYRAPRQNRTTRTLDLLLYLQRLPRTFDQIRVRYPRVSERTIWRMLSDVRDVAELTIDRCGRYSVTLRWYDDGRERRVR